MSKRSDIHRVGAIIPENYDLVLCYSLSSSEDGHPVPPFGVNCEVELRNHSTGENGKHRADSRCCIIALRRSGVRWSEHGTTGKCTACGAAFVHGDVWRHRDGEHIHVGRVCADKYGLLADRGGYDAAYEAHKRGTAAYRLGVQNAAARAAFLAANPGLEGALEADHPILADLSGRFRRFLALSEGQVLLALKIAHEIANPPPPEKHVAAPEGRVTVRGRVVSVKEKESDFGVVWKMTVKVETPAGSWLVWGTCPESLCEHGRNTKPGDMPGGLKGTQVEFVATLKRGQDAHFALASRPAKARVLTAANATDIAA